MVHKDLCQKKLEKHDSLNYGEVYHLLKDLKKNIKGMQDEKTTNIQHYAKLVTIFKSDGNIIVEANRNQILNTRNEASLLAVLSLMFGEKFYHTDEFNYIFRSCYNLQIPKQMYFTSKPNSLEETKRLLASIRTMTNSGNMEIAQKINMALNILCRVIEHSASRVFTMSQEVDDSYKIILNILNACDHNETISSENLDYICEIFNRNVFFENVNTKTVGELKVGDCLVDFIQGYNHNIVPLREAKEYEKKFKEYYRKITKLNFNQLENSDLPDYNDPKFLNYMRDMLLKLETEPNKDEEYCKRYAIASMHYGLYFRR